MRKSLIAVSLFSTILAAPLVAVRPAHAGFFDFLNKVNETVNTVRTVQGVIQYSRELVNSFNGTLGISNDRDRFVQDDPVASAINLYTDWNQTLTPADKELVQYVVNAKAKSKPATYEVVAEADWFKAKTPQEQAKLSSTYMKLSKILELAQADEKRFLGYAFCLQSGETECEK